MIGSAADGDIGRPLAASGPRFAAPAVHLSAVGESGVGGVLGDRGSPLYLNQVRQPRRGDALQFAAGPPGPKAILTGCQQIVNGVRGHVLGSVAVNCGGTQAVAAGDGAEGEGVREQVGLDRCALRMGTCCAWPRHPSTLPRGRLAGLRMPTGLPRPGFYRCPAPRRTTPTSVNAAGPPACGCRARVRRAPYRARSQSPAASFRRGTPALRLGGGRRVGAAGALVMAAVTIVADGHADDRAADGNSRNICTQGAPRVSVGCRGFSSRTTTSARRAGERGRWYAMGVSNRLTANV